MFSSNKGKFKFDFSFCFFELAIFITKFEKINTLHILIKRTKLAKKHKEAIKFLEIATDDEENEGKRRPQAGQKVTLIRQERLYDIRI